MTESIEQQIQLYGTLSTIFLIAAIVFLVLAIALFVLFRIPQTFNEYRGKSAQKAIAEMAANSADSGSLVSSASLRKSKSGSILNRKRSYTDSLSDDLSGDISQGQPGAQEFPAGMETSRMDLDYSDSNATSVMNDFGENFTTVMNDPGENATTVMNDPGENATTVMGVSAASQEEGTMVLGAAPTPAEEGTMVLNASQIPAGDGTMVLDQSLLKRNNPEFVVERSIMIIHTDEVI